MWLQSQDLGNIVAMLLNHFLWGMFSPNWVGREEITIRIHGILEHET